MSKYAKGAGVSSQLDCSDAYCCPSPVSSGKSHTQLLKELKAQAKKLKRTNPSREKILDGSINFEVMSIYKLDLIVNALNDELQDESRKKRGR